MSDTVHTCKCWNSYQCRGSACVLSLSNHHYHRDKRKNGSSPPAGEWSSPNITGQPPTPCSSFSLTPVGERRAALFGGVNGSAAISDDLFIVDLSRDTVVSVIV